MQYKDIAFTIENADKYPEAKVVRDTYDGGQDLGIREWHISKDGNYVFIHTIKYDWNRWSIVNFYNQWKLRIPVEYRKVQLTYTKRDNGGVVHHSGYSIHIDEQGNPFGEPFKTEQ